MPATESPTHGTTSVLLAELIALRARAGKPVAGRTREAAPRAGAHVARVRGRGMDYAESRVYQPGDDARTIDWRRTARSGKWHTKVFQIERERAVVAMVDTHPTMRFGTRVRFKSVAAARAAAWLAWTSVRGGDRVGALAFGAVRDALDARPGVRGALAVAGALTRWDAAMRAEGVNMAEPLSVALQRVQRLAPHGGQVWLLSDGWCTDDSAAPVLAHLARRVDLRVVIVVDALERDLAPPGAYRFDTASGQCRVDLSRTGARAAFRSRMAQGKLQLAAACDRAGVAWVELPAGADPAVRLTPLLRRRARRP
ncbi:MAG: DUF58 domain-containing protein [Rhodanobacteraceae bacterium]|nr:MAG: DUF58 domain-containing protein [Rhodanobacteraceae bacterium]